MTSLLAHAIFTLRRGRFALLALLCAASLPFAAQAQQPPKQEKFYATDKVMEELGKIRPLIDAKKWDEAVAAIDVLIKTAAPNSYDLVMLCNLKFQYLFNKGDYAKAIEPMETALAVSEQFHYLEKNLELELTNYLAQLYTQEAVAKGTTAEQQKQYFTKAAEYAERVIQRNPKPTAENYYLYSQILFYWALSVPNKTDQEMLKKARTAIEECRLLSIQPKEQQMQLLLNILLQGNDYAASSELLELLVKEHPTSKSYWPTLQQVYFALAGDKDPKKSFDYNVRAIVTMERAQALGQLNTSKDNFILVGIYSNIQQYERATELLQAGLKNGTIDSEQKNWEFLAMFYQQINQELKAIEVLKEATALFPKAGSLHFQIANLYALIEKSAQAYDEAMKALEIGNLEKPGAVYDALTYWSFDLRKYDEALIMANKALGYPEGQKDAQLPRVKLAIEDSIKEREFNKAAIEGQPPENQQAPDAQTKPPEPTKQPEKKQTKSL